MHDKWHTVIAREAEGWDALRESIVNTPELKDEYNHVKATGLCDCGRVIDGSRTLAASVFEKCSRCRHKPRNKGPRKIPQGLTTRATVLREVQAKLTEFDSEFTYGEDYAAARLKHWLREQLGDA